MQKDEDEIYDNVKCLAFHVQRGARLCYGVLDDDRFHLFAASGEYIADGETLAELLLAMPRKVK
jgi:hypothetical protein